MIIVDLKIDEEICYRARMFQKKKHLHIYSYSK